MPSPRRPFPAQRPKRHRHPHPSFQFLPPAWKYSNSWLLHHRCLHHLSRHHRRLPVQPVGIRPRHLVRSRKQVLQPRLLIQSHCLLHCRTKRKSPILPFPHVLQLAQQLGLVWPVKLSCLQVLWPSPFVSV